jgi:hypothetical protein
VRVRADKLPPNREWAFAVAGSAAVACCQLLPYELPLLLLGLPYLVRLVLSPQASDRRWAVPLAAFALFAFADGGDGDWYYQAIRLLVDANNTALTAVLQSHRAIGTAGVLLTVLVAGPRGAVAERDRTPCQRRGLATATATP